MPFINFLADSWNGEFKHQYIIRDCGWKKYRNGDAEWSIDNLKSALEQYWWKGNFEDTELKIKKFREDWENAKLQNDLNADSDLVIKIFKWGGVYNCYTKKSVDDTPDIFKKIKDSIITLSNDAGETDSFHKHGHYMNSAYTKVYGILDNRFIIYDGRVGAGLGLLARSFLPTVADKVKHEELVSLLAFPFKKERASKRNYIPLNESSRNASNDFYKFTLLGDHCHHAKWMLRASWITEKVIERLGLPGVSSREFESALFMVGYHVAPMPV